MVIPDASSLPAVLEMQKDLLVVAESTESAALKDTPRHAIQTSAAQAQDQNPWLELMNQDLPDIPETHRTLLDEESLIGATIVLDVLTTHSAPINEEDTILSDVAQLLLDAAGAVALSRREPLRPGVDLGLEGALGLPITKLQRVVG